MNANTWFSGTGVAVVASIISFAIGFFRLFFILVPHPIFNIIDEERSLLNNNLRILKKIILEVTGFLVISFIALLISSLTIEENHFVTRFPFISSPKLPPNLYILGILIFITILIVLLLIKYHRNSRMFAFEKMRKSVRSANIRNKTIFVVAFLFVVYGYLIIPLYYFGYFVNLFLLALAIGYGMNVSNTIEVIFVLSDYFTKGNILVLVFLYLAFYLIYRYLINHLFYVLKVISYPKILSTITLTNGDKLVDKYILRPSIDGSILIGNEATIHESNEKIILPNQNILYIEFKRIYSFFEPDVELNSEINTVTPEGTLGPRSKRYRK